VNQRKKTWALPGTRRRVQKEHLQDGYPDKTKKLAHHSKVAEVTANHLNRAKNKTQGIYPAEKRGTNQNLSFLKKRVGAFHIKKKGKKKTPQRKQNTETEQMKEGLSQGIVQGGPENWCQKLN